MPERAQGILSENVDPTRAVDAEFETNGLVVSRKKVRETVSPFNDCDNVFSKVIGKAQLFRLLRVRQTVEVQVSHRRPGRVNLGDGVARAVDEGPAEVSDESPGEGSLSRSERALEGENRSGAGMFRNAGA
jgi:hypothetical protein